MVLELDKSVSGNRLPSVQYGGLPGRYIFSQLHWHWGGDSSRGSEHRFGHKQYPAELHLVSYNSKYGSFSQALKQRDGLAVMGVIFKVHFSSLFL